MPYYFVDTMGISLSHIYVAMFEETNENKGVFALNVMMLSHEMNMRIIVVDEVGGCMKFDGGFCSPGF